MIISSKLKYIFRFLAICYWSSKSSFLEAKTQMHRLDIYDTNEQVVARKTQVESRLVSCGDFVAMSVQRIVCDGALDDCRGGEVEDILRTCRSFLGESLFTPRGVKGFRQQAMAVLSRLTPDAIQVEEQPKNDEDDEGDEGICGEEDPEHEGSEIQDDKSDEAEEEVEPNDVAKSFYAIAERAGDCEDEDLAEQERLFSSFLEGNYRVSMRDTEVDMGGNLRALRNAEFRCVFNSFATAVSSVLPFGALVSLRPAYMQGEWSELHRLFYKCLVLLRLEGPGDNKHLCNTELIMALWPKLPRTSAGKPDNYQDPDDIFDQLILRFAPLARFFDMRHFKPTDASRKLSLDEILKRTPSDAMLHDHTDAMPQDQSKIVVVHIGSATSLSGRGAYWKGMYGGKYPQITRFCMSELGVSRQFLDAQTCKTRSCDSSLSSAQRCQEFYGWALIRHHMLGQSFDMLKKISPDFATQEEFNALFPILNVDEKREFSNLTGLDHQQIKRFLKDRKDLVNLVNPFLPKPIPLVGPLLPPPAIDAREESHGLVEFVLFCIASKMRFTLSYERELARKVVGDHMKNVRPHVDVNVSIHTESGLSYQVGAVVALKQNHFVAVLNRGDGTDLCKAETRDCLLKCGVSKLRESTNGVFPIQAHGAPHLIFLVPFLDPPAPELDETDVRPQSQYECPICLSGEVLVDMCSKSCGHCFCFACTQHPRLHANCPICRIALTGFQRLVAEAPIIERTFDGRCPDCAQESVALCRANVPCGHLMCHGCVDNPISTCSTCNEAVLVRIVVLDTAARAHADDYADDQQVDVQPHFPHQPPATRLNSLFNEWVEEPPVVAAAGNQWNGVLAPVGCVPIGSPTPMMVRAPGATVTAVGRVVGRVVVADEHTAKEKRKSQEKVEGKPKKGKVVSGPSAKDLYDAKLVPCLHFLDDSNNVLGRFTVKGQAFTASVRYLEARESAKSISMEFIVTKMGSSEKSVSARLASEDWERGLLQVMISRLMARTETEEFSLLLIPIFEYLNRTHFHNHGGKASTNVLISQDVTEDRDVLPTCKVKQVCKELKTVWKINSEYSQIPFDLSTLKTRHGVKFEGIDD
jgi:hypothetical protein